MKKHLIFTSIFLLLITFAFGQTQTEMNQDAQAEYKKVEKEINSIYQKILKEYSSNTEFIKKIKVAERLWIQFRDAEVGARYPEERENYGSIYSTCVYTYMTQLTQERIKTLKQWLTGIHEGDACSGSIKTN